MGATALIDAARLYTADSHHCVRLVDDVLTTGKTLLAVLELLGKAGVRVEDVRLREADSQRQP